MKKVRKAHLWIGLIASIFIFMEALTGLLMNEPWLIGQTQAEGMRGNFQLGQMNQQWQNRQGSLNGQADGQNQGQNWQGRNGFNGNGQGQGQNGFNGNGQFQGRSRFGGNFNGTFPGRQSQGIMATIRSLHEGRLGNTNIKWLLDLAAVAMMILTGTGIYLSVKVLRAENKRKKLKDDVTLS